MTKVILLDSGPLGMLAHAKAHPAILNWLRSLTDAGAKVVVPEIADYEVRRELIRARKERSIRRLDDLKQRAIYLRLTTDVRSAETISAAVSNSHAFAIAISTC